MLEINSEGAATELNRRPPPENVCKVINLCGKGGFFECDNFAGVTRHFCGSDATILHFI